MIIGALQAGLEVLPFGGGSRTGRRAAGKCFAPIQAEGAAGGHHQGSEASLLLPEARREETRQGSFGAQAESQKGSKRAGLKSSTAAGSTVPIAFDGSKTRAAKKTSEKRNGNRGVAICSNASPVSVGCSTWESSGIYPVNQFWDSLPRPLQKQRNAKDY